MQWLSQCYCVPWFQFQNVFIYLFSLDCCTVLRIPTAAEGVLCALKYGGNLESPQEMEIIMHSGCLGTRKLNHPSLKGRNCPVLGPHLRAPFLCVLLCPCLLYSCGCLSWEPMSLVPGEESPDGLCTRPATLPVILSVRNCLWISGEL